MTAVEVEAAVRCYGGPLDGQAFTLEDWQTRVTAAHAVHAATGRLSVGQPALWYEPTGEVPAERLPTFSRDKRAVSYAEAGFEPVLGARWVGGDFARPRGSHWRDHEHDGGE